MQVKLREKKLRDGRTSFYLDIYADGKRSYEFLKLYLVPVKNAFDRDHNKQTKMQALSLCAKRQLDVQSASHGLVSPTKRGLTLLDYFETETNKRRERDVDYSSWMSALKHLKGFIGKEHVLLSAIDEGWLERFKEYLIYDAKKTSGERISQNSAHHYFNRIKLCFKVAYRDKIIADNPADRVDYIEQKETKREFLTMEELQKLAQTECRYPILKTAFIFSCLTGLRWADIQQLTWSEVRFDEKTGWGIYFTQKKTDGVEYLPMSDQARKLLGEERGEPDDRVFLGLKYSGHHNDELVKWCLRAGITKHITFHCARHTNATLLLANGVDIYTVSKLLGHKELQTTQIYAKLVNEKKIEAVNKIPQINFE